MKKWGVLLLALSASALPAQQPADASQGQGLFAANCAVCHGVGGSGGPSRVDLTRGQFKHGGGDQELFNTISKGVPGTEMPGSFLDAGQIRQLVEFVRLLSSSAAQPNGAADAARGEALFRGKGECLPCHRVTEEVSHGEALRVGPSLYGIGERRSVTALRNSILNVHRNLSEAILLVNAVTKTGKQVTGMRLNEDTYSVQLRDGEGNLVTLLKKDLQQCKIERGDERASFPQGLTTRDVNDLAAYLATLRREGAQ